jgi:hypothetical protein
VLPAGEKKLLPAPPDAFPMLDAQNDIGLNATLP